MRALTFSAPSLPGQSLIEFNADPVVLLTLSALIIIGGLGFLVWENIARKRSLRKFSVYTKLVLLITAALLAVGWAGTCLLEWNNPETLGGMTVGRKAAQRLFPVRDTAHRGVCGD